MCAVLVCSVGVVIGGCRCITGGGGARAAASRMRLFRTVTIVTSRMVDVNDADSAGATRGLWSAGFFYSHPMHAAAATPTGNNQSVSLGYTSVASPLSGCAGLHAMSASLTVGSDLQRVITRNTMKNRIFACLAWPLLVSWRTQPSRPWVTAQQREFLWRSSK